jgi:hypothetical protein
MRQQPVVGHGDAAILRDHPQNRRHRQRLPGEEEQRGNRPDMEEHKKQCERPVQAAGCGFKKDQFFI